MQNEEFTMRSWSDTELFARVATPEHDSRGTVVISHGYAEHSGRYQHYMDSLVSAGWKVIAFDHSGHGKSEGVSGLIQRMKHWAYEIDNFVDRARADESHKPLAVLGHSAGAAAALRFVADHEEKIDAVILSSTYLRNAEPVSGALIFAAKLLNLVAPVMAIKPFDSAYVSRDPDVVAAYDSDPLVYSGNVRVRTGLELVGGYDLALESAPRITTPALMLHGTGDRVADIEAARAIFGRLGSQNKEFKIFEGLYHEIHNEPEGPSVIEYVVSWLDRALQEGRSPSEA